MKICFISDTHCQHPNLPKADLLIHAGDLTGSGSMNAFIQEVEWLESIKKNFPLGIIYVPGNHDRGLDTAYSQRAWDYWAKDPYHRYPPAKKVGEASAEIKEIFKKAGIEVLINQSLVVQDLKIYGSPMTPIFMDWAFMDTEENLAKVWETIPQDTQILVTHGPAQGLRDLCVDGHVGSSSLRCYLDNNLPELKVHAFGHIHEGAGHHQEGRYLCLNSAVLDGRYKGFNPIQVVDTESWKVE